MRPLFSSMAWTSALGIILTGLAMGQSVPQPAIPAEVTPPQAARPNQGTERQPSVATAAKEDATASEGTDVTVDPASILPDLPPLPKAKASLIGGTIGKLDRVRDQITVSIFGGGKIKIAYDTRTHIYRNGAEASASDLRQGDRIYVETILDGSAVFARNIRLKTSTTAGETQGVVTSFRADKGELQIRDALSPRPVKIHIGAKTRITGGDHAADENQLVPGALVAVKFGPQKDGAETAEEISIQAVPGASFTFAGRVEAVDLRMGILVLNSSTDHKTYEISVDPASVQLSDSVKPSAEVTVLTSFEGNRYVARSLTVNARANEHADDEHKDEH